ncbi:outer membrane beta-barrel protein [Mucilaginibacter achroorhodeus]|uniref:Outer membrane beta-barrel protein n=1 Tax=Mucilaginibacter achroorhodeus TaxID=2599294 RepID=A0A563TYW2_9SPHI|nr:outer membrane beta-barrel protein [Mucilaginibacter achroorhodeus]TWR24557.1 outer membrane beta-barrel protein [Mucilaginibacter achroorhodeus]
MNFKNGCLLVAFLLCINFCYAQTGITFLRGTVLTQNNQPADAATAILLHLPDSTVATSALVDEKGAFQFNNIKPGSYTILATMLGYKRTYTQSFYIAAGKPVSLAPLKLAATNTQLKDVAITARKAFVEVKPGKTIINPSASIIADGQSALDILRQSPGVRVDNNDAISVSGRQQALVLIDGKPTNLTGTDLVALLKSTQGSNIDKMELITGGSPKYDAAAGGIVNIVLKKGKNIGTNGTITLGAGYGRYYKSNSGISFNNRTKSYNIFGNYNFAANKSYKNFNTDRGIDYNGLQSNYNTAYRSVSETFSHNFRLGTDFFIGEGQTIGLLVAGNINNAKFNKANTLSIFNNNVKDSTVYANSNLKRDINTFTYNLNYNGKVDETGGVISASLTHTRNSRASNEYINNTFYNAAGAAYRNPLLLQNLSPTKVGIWSAILDYTKPLGKTAKLDAGAKYSYTKTDNNLIFGPLVNNVYTIDTTFSNHFIYTEKIAAGYVNYNARFGKTNISAGIRGEYTNSRGDSYREQSPNNQHITARNYFNLFPTVQIEYHHDDKNDYVLNFNRGITRPAYDKLNPFLSFIDLYSYQAGNAYLRPVYANSISLTHTYNQEISTRLYATFANGAAFPFYQQNDATKVIINTDVNLGRTQTLGVAFSAPIKFTSWWNSSYDIDASYQRYIADPKYGDFNQSVGDVLINTTQSFKLGSKLAAELSGYYETPTVYGINNFKAVYYANAGVSLPVLNKMGKLSLTLLDIFKTRRDRAYTNYQNLNRNTVDWREYRILSVNFSYRFGKTSVKGAVRHKTGNEDEQRRIGGN